MLQELLTAINPLNSVLSQGSLSGLFDASFARDSSLNLEVHRIHERYCAHHQVIEWGQGLLRAWPSDVEVLDSAVFHNILPLAFQADAKVPVPELRRDHFFWTQPPGFESAQSDKSGSFQPRV